MQLYLSTVYELMRETLFKRTYTAEHITFILAACWYLTRLTSSIGIFNGFIKSK